MSPVTRLTVSPVARLAEKWSREFPAKRGSSQSGVWSFVFRCLSAPPDGMVLQVAAATHTTGGSDHWGRPDRPRNWPLGGGRGPRSCVCTSIYMHIQNRLSIIAQIVATSHSKYNNNKDSHNESIEKKQETIRQQKLINRKASLERQVIAR